MTSNKPITLDSNFSDLNIPMLELVFEEAFAIPGKTLLGHQPIYPKTVGELVQQSILKPELIIKRLEEIRVLSENIEMSCHELKDLLHAESKPLLIDVRQAWEIDIAKIGDSIPLTSIDLGELIEQNSQNPRDIVTICHHGVRSFSAAMHLRKEGLTQVRSLTGGVDAWAQTIDTDMARY